jgi:hypothetical protein
MAIKPDRLINEPRNIMTIITHLDEEFGRLTIALEPTVNQDVYKIKTYPGFPSFYSSMMPTNAHGEKFVRFTKQSDLDTELPCPIRLATHAAIARILHASGMAEAIDQILDNLEALRGLRQLAPNGTTDLTRHFSLLLLN